MPSCGINIFYIFISRSGTVEQTGYLSDTKWILCEKTIKTTQYFQKHLLQIKYIYISINKIKNNNGMHTHEHND